MNFKNIVVKIGLLAAGALLGLAPVAHAQIYINDGTLSKFTGPITSYATFTNFGCTETGIPGVAPYTPDASTVASGYRVFNDPGFGSCNSSSVPNPIGVVPPADGGNWIIATFHDAVSTIIVFPNIDHFGDSYDGYQYKIAGSNDGVTWDPLFDALTVTGTSEPFQLGTHSGTGPLIVNNVATPGTGPGGTVGYEAFFDFGKTYKYYAFGTSSLATTNTEQELSAVGTGPMAITHPLQGNGATNTFDFGFAKYIVVYPAASSVPANTTMTLYANVLSPADCTSAVNIASFSGDEPRCTTFTSTNPGNFSVIFDVACSLNGASSSSSQCPTTGGFDPLATPLVPHSNLDISNILTYASTDLLTGYAPQMLTAHEGNDDWVAFGVGFQSDCCTRGSGGSSYNSLVVSADFPSTTNSLSSFAIPAFTFYGFQPPVGMSPIVNVAKAGSTIPFKWQLLYPVDAALGFNGGPVTNLNFPPLGYWGLAVTANCNGTAPSYNEATIPVETETATGLMNLGGGFYQYNWQTPLVFKGHSLVGQCLVVTTSMGDNINYNVNISFH